MTNSSAHQFATVNLNGDAAETIRIVMRQTGWNVEQSLAHVLSRVVERYERNNNLTELSDMAIEGNEVGVQLVKNTITAHPFQVDDLVTVRVPTEDDEVTLKLYGRVYGFAPQGVAILLTDRSIAEAESYDVHINKDDLWGHEDIELL